MDLIIQPEEVGILARPISQHIDREQLVAYITEVEQLQIRSALGGVLFSNIKQSPSAFAIILDGGIDEVGEVSGGIRKAMAYYVYARIIREGGTMATRFGAVEKTDEYATRLEQEKKNTIYRECNNIADAYMAEVVNYAKAQGWMSAEGVNPTRRMAYVVGSEEADVDKMPCKSRLSVSANLVAGDGINIVDGEISVDMGEVQHGTGILSLAQRVTNAEINIEEVRILATQQEEITVGNGLIKDDKGDISIDFEVVASNAEITNIRTNANEAKTEAEQAKKLAEDAISTLDVINKIASDAETTAQSAKMEADSAVTTAVDAVGVASNALEKANQATESANDALAKANSAQTSATNAEESAEASAQSASNAKSSAEKSQASAEEVAKGIASIDGKVSESVSKAVEGAFDDVNQALAKQEEELETKAPKVGYAPDLKVDFAKELVGRGVAEPQYIGDIRPTGLISIGDGNATIERIKGESVVWNQGAVNPWIVANCTTTFQDGVYMITPKAEGRTQVGIRYLDDFLCSAFSLTHTYLCTASVRCTNTKGIILGQINGLGSVRIQHYVSETCSNTWQKISFIWKEETANSSYYPSCIKYTANDVSDVLYVRDWCIHDLTQMFNGINVPETIEEFEARKPLNVSNEYNEGTIVSYNGDALKSVGFNAWDEKWENGLLDSKGLNLDSATALRSTNYIQVVPNATYMFGCPSNTGNGVAFFDADKNIISPLKPLNANTTFTTPPNCAYIRFDVSPSYGGVYKKDISIHLVHTGYRNGEYQPYEEDTLQLPNIKAIKDKDGNQLFPYGLLSAGSAHDEITATKAVKRVMAIDMGAWSWTYNTTYGGFILNNTSNRPAAKTQSYMLCAKYHYKGAHNNVNDKEIGYIFNNSVFVKDSSYTDATSFKQAMQGVMLYYELAEPIEVDLPEPLNLTYDAWDFGTEELIAEGKTTPLNADIVYQFNAVDRIRENTAKNQALEAELAELKAQLTQLTQVTNNEDSNA